MFAKFLIPSMISVSVHPSDAKFFTTICTFRFLGFISDIQSVIAFSRAGDAGFETLNGVDLRFAIFRFHYFVN